jgi:hypothetical protein
MTDCKIACTVRRSVTRILLLMFALSHTQLGASEFSDAETALWLTDQLNTVHEPMVFTYKFERNGSYDADFQDTVRFIVTKVKEDGMKSASVEFFTGVRRVDVPPVESTNVNPILKIYLQGDVYEMNRLTDADGNSRERWRYFQRKIKLAMAESASVEKTSIRYEGSDYRAQIISFVPFVGDKKLNDSAQRPAEMRALYQGLANKSYRVVVSEELPGFLFRIETIVPGYDQGDPPLIHETLQLIETSRP